MAYRFTNTEKWQDSWFSELKQLEMLLFLYLCDNCDIAGFIEINLKRWATDLNSSKETIEGALKGLQKGLMYSKTNDCIYIRNFLKHQKNLPINEANMAHKGIIKRFEIYLYKFEYETINEFIEGASKGLQSPIGIGNGIEIGNENKESVIIKNWRNDFETYKEELRQAWKTIMTKEYIEERQSYHPKLNIRETLKKACADFWATDDGWKNKKASRSKEINWKSTFNKTLTYKENAVYKEEMKYNNPFG